MEAYVGSNLSNLDKLAMEIRSFLINNKMFQCVNIYYDCKCINKNGVHLNVDVESYIENHENILSMTFENKFYKVINNHTDSKIMLDFKKILRKYGYTYKQSDSWNLTLIAL